MTETDGEFLARIEADLALIPAPPEAIDLADWHWAYDETENCYDRLFVVRRWFVNSDGRKQCQVDLAAEQFAIFDREWRLLGGGIRNWVVLVADYSGGDFHDSTPLRELGAAVMAAADELDCRKSLNQNRSEPK
jgi:hypothetical protein